MKKYILQTVSDSGELIKENTLELQEGSKLICTVNTKYCNVETAQSTHNIIENLLKEGNVITIPDFVKLQVLNIK